MLKALDRSERTVVDLISDTSWELGGQEPLHFPSSGICGPAGRRFRSVYITLHPQSPKRFCF